MKKKAAPQKSCVCAYVRVSTLDQVVNGVSLEAQEERVHAYATAHGMTIDHVFREEGVSAAKKNLDERPQSRAMLDVHPTAIIALKLDRLFRSTEDCLASVGRWDKNGTALHIVDMGGMSLATSTAMGRMFLTLIAAFAEFERNLIAERTSTALQYKMANGEFIGQVPYGFKRNGTTLVQLQEEYVNLEMIVQLRRDGASLRSIATTLNSQGILTKYGKQWAANSVKQVIDRLGRENSQAAM